MIFAAGYMYGKYKEKNKQLEKLENDISKEEPEKEKQASDESKKEDTSEGIGVKFVDGGISVSPKSLRYIFKRRTT